jgi:hypothetical protein
VITAQGKWWDIGTAAHIDWPPQSRLVEVVDNHDGTLSIFCTMVDHDHDPVVGFARELMGNDPHAGFAGGTGKPEDRNVELVVKNPYPPAALARGSRPTMRVPATPAASNLTIGGALALAGAKKLIDFRERSVS